jgi:hypothetical protein
MNKLKLISAFAFALAFAGKSFAADADEEIIGKYGAITIKNVDRIGNNGVKVKWTVAYIDDSSDETPVIPEDIQVDSVYYSRVFKTGVYSTLMLPFDAPTWKFQGFGAYSFVSISKDQNNSTEYSIYVQEFLSDLKANTPYIVISTGSDNSTISYNMEYQPPEKITFNTTTNTRSHTFSSGGYNWEILGTYERIEFKNPKGIYGFAAKEKNNTKIGQFTKAACSDTSCAYIRPFRAYLKCTLPKASQVRGLAKSADDVASLDDLPKNIEVHIVEENGDRTYLGTLNTYTGEITVEDRWFDMKGRRLQQKPTAKGTYFNNKKKVVIK